MLVGEAATLLTSARPAAAAAARVNFMVLREECDGMDVSEE